MALIELCPICGLTAGNFHLSHNILSPELESIEEVRKRLEKRWNDAESNRDNMGDDNNGSDDKRRKTN
jgi:hypothetical protein